MKKVLLSMISLLLLAVMPANAQNTVTTGDYIIKADFIPVEGYTPNSFFAPFIGNNKTLNCAIQKSGSNLVLAFKVPYTIWGQTVELKLPITAYPIADDKVEYGKSGQGFMLPSSIDNASSPFIYTICGADGDTGLGVVSLDKIERVRDVWNVSDFGFASNESGSFAMKVMVRNAMLIKDLGNENKEYAEVKISASGFASFCPVYQNVTIPAGVQILTIENSNILPGTKDGAAYSYVNTGEVDSDAIIGWEEGVLVMGEPGTTVQFPYTFEQYTVLPDNCLTGATTDVTATGYHYAFTTKEVDGSILPVLRHVAPGTTIPQGKAYYVPATVPTTASAEIVNILIDDDATAIVSVESDKTIDNNEVYSIAGQKVGADYKGIVIRNGKKMLVK